MFKGLNLRKSVPYAAVAFFAAVVVLFLASGIWGRQAKDGLKGKELQVFAGAASKPPLEEVAQAFERETGVRVSLTFGGSGAVLSQMKLARRGDIYLPGSSDFMEVAKREGVVDPLTEKIVVYLVPALSVPKGNPQNIRSLEDLAGRQVKVALARPDTVCVGLYGAEILEREGLAERVKKNIVVYAESCEKVAQLVALRQVDVAIGWDVFASWEPDKIETVYLPAEKVPRIGYIPVGISTYTEEADLARQFIDYLVSEKGKSVFRKWGYITEEEEARKLAPKALVGGEYKLKSSW